MDDSSGPPGDFAQRYLTRQSYSPGQFQGIYSMQGTTSNPHFLNSMQENEFSPFKNRSPECQKILNRISTFCGKENLVQRVAFLDQELSVFGYPSIVTDLEYEPDSSTDEQKDGAIDLVTLVNISYDLLRSWRQSFEIQSESNDIQRTSEAEIVRLRHIASRLKEDLATKDRDLKSKELMQLQLTQRLESLKKKFKLEQDKCKRLSGEMTARDSQFKHEKKKKVQEIEKLQARLQQLLQDKRHERMLGIEILNSLQRSDGKRGKWSTDKTKKNNEQDMYRLIITNYEDSQKQLLKENDGMRKYLKEMQNELISALNERNTTSSAHDQSHSSTQGGVKGQNDGDKEGSSRSSSAASNMSDNSDVSEPMSDGMFEMPYDLVKEDIEKSIRNKWRVLKKEIRKNRNADRTPQANKENFTENEYDDLVQQQQELIDYLTTGQGESSDRPIPEDCYFLEEKADFEKEKNIFKQQKQAFDKERQLYAEALLQLDEQRQSFETEKNKWLQQNFLQLTPFRATDKRPSTSPHPNQRNKEPPSNRMKATRQQPYQPRPSVSPDRPLKVSDHQQQSSNYQSQQHMQNSPNNISHTLSRLHSSSHHNSFSPDNMAHRSPDPSWQSRTPENNQQHKVSSINPHRAKSTPNTTNSMLPPSTAELYRSLGLVYYGSDKENEETVNSGNTDSQICPRSSGTSKQNHHSTSHRATQQHPTYSKLNSESFKVKIQPKVYPLQRKQTSTNIYASEKNEAPPSPEFVSAEGSIEGENYDQKSTESDYYDAEKSFRNGSPRKNQRVVPKERGSRTISKNGIENVPFFTNEFQISQKLPEPGSHFIFSTPQKRRLYASKSLDEKTFRYDCENPEYPPQEAVKPKKSGIKNFVRNLIVGSPKRKERDDNNNDTASSNLLSNSDSALSLRYYLDRDMESWGQRSLHPSARVLSNTEIQDFDKAQQIFSAKSVKSSEEVSHHRAWSFSGNESLNSECRKPRSFSFDSPVLSEAAERHKSALISISANFKPSGSESNNSGQLPSPAEPVTSQANPKSSRYDLKRNFEGLAISSAEKISTTRATTIGSLKSVFARQYDPSSFENWSSSSHGPTGFKPMVKVTSKSLIDLEGNQRRQKPEQTSSNQIHQTDSNQLQLFQFGSNKPRPVSASYNWSQQTQNSFNQPSANLIGQNDATVQQTDANQLKPESVGQSQQLESGSDQSDSVPTAQTSASLLEQLALADQSYGSIADDDLSTSETS